ncbi:hypothetical protein ACJ72_04204 [Emergomyces africanus]|uniref:Uncharacterized protein n=1 Tax=Emergomyces africanus TaxID=1955775 RepID=A0A1B7NXE9_9EURO|nr:hypothetical protein ACJ72_04204 [Emergomyces africanus]
MAPNTDIATRSVVVALKSICEKTSIEISGITGLSVRAINLIYARAIERGFDPNARPFVIRDAWLADAPRSGRPKKKTSEEVQEQGITQYGKNQDICHHEYCEFLKAAGFRKTKSARKPGLTKRT